MNSSCCAFHDLSYLEASGHWTVLNLVVVMWLGAVSVIVVKQSPVGGKQEFVFDCSSNEWCFPVWKHSKVSVSNFFAHKVRGQSTILSQLFVFKLAGVAVRHCQLPVRVPLLHVDCPEFLVSLLVSNLKKLFAATNYMPIVFIHVA